MGGCVGESEGGEEGEGGREEEEEEDKYKMYKKKRLASDPDYEKGQYI